MESLIRATLQIGLEPLPRRASDSKVGEDIQKDCMVDCIKSRGEVKKNRDR